MYGDSVTSAFDCALATAAPSRVMVTENDPRPNGNVHTVRPAATSQVWTCDPTLSETCAGAVAKATTSMVSRGGTLAGTTCASAVCGYFGVALTGWSRYETKRASRSITGAAPVLNQVMS